MIDVIVPGAEVEPLPVILPGSDASIYTRQGSNKSFASSPEKQYLMQKQNNYGLLIKRNFPVLIIPKIRIKLLKNHCFSLFESILY